MPIFSIVAPKIPAEDKDKFLAAIPSLIEEVKAQPGVAYVAAGPVVVENGKPVEEFKFVQTLGFKTKEEFETFKNSAWAVESKKKFEEHNKEEPVIGEFEMESPPPAGPPKPYLLFSVLELDDESKGEAAKKTWMDLVAALGQTETGGGKSIRDGPIAGIGLLGYDSAEEAKAAFEKPGVAAALAAYKALGKDHTALVHIQYS